MNIEPRKPHRTALLRLLGICEFICVALGILRISELSLVTIGTLQKMLTLASMVVTIQTAVGRNTKPPVTLRVLFIQPALKGEMKTIWSQNFQVPTFLSLQDHFASRLVSFASLGVNATWEQGGDKVHFSAKRPLQTLTFEGVELRDCDLSLLGGSRYASSNDGLLCGTKSPCRLTRHPSALTSTTPRSFKGAAPSLKILAQGRMAGKLLVIGKCQSPDLDLGCELFSGSEAIGGAVPSRSLLLSHH